MQLYKRLRREYEHGLGTISGVAQKYKVHRRTVRAALKAAVPPKRRVTPRERPKMALAIPFIDAILENDLKAPFSQRHTAHQIWDRMQIEMPASDIGESTVRAYVRVRKAELDVAEAIFMSIRRELPVAAFGGGGCVVFDGDDCHVSPDVPGNSRILAF